MSGQNKMGPKQRSYPAAVQWAVIAALCLPGVTWLSTTGNIADYWRYDVPPGQVIYVLSKLAALYAFVVFWMQLIYGLLGPAGRTRLRIERGHAFHVNLGSTVIALVALHAALFVLGASVRTHTFASQYLTPSFASGYYRTAITLGIIAAVLVVIAVFCASARRLWRRVWRLGHWAVIPAFALASVHSLLIGSESRIEPMTILYMGGIVIALLVMVWRVWMRAQPDSSGTPQTFPASAHLRNVHR
jgi:uncharacterized membrane protein YkvI